MNRPVPGQPSDESEDGLSETEVAELWDRYYPRLKQLVAGRVRAMKRPVASESEIALSAFNSVIQKAKKGDFPEYKSGPHLWRLLKTVALRKTFKTHRRLRAAKRGGSNLIIGQADAAGEDQATRGVDAAAGQKSIELDDVHVTELFEQLFGDLPDERYRSAVLLKLQGADTETIADCLSSTTRTVQRMLKSVHDSWQAELLRD